MDRSSSMLSDLNRLDDILSEASQCNFGEIQAHAIPYDAQSMANISEISDTDTASISSDKTIIYLKYVAADFPFSTIYKADIVELSAVTWDQIWVRAVKYDELYIQLLEKNAAEFHAMCKEDFEVDDVVLVPYCGDYSRGIFKGETVHLMDIGNSVASNDELRGIYASSMDFKRMAVPLKLNLPGNLSIDERAALEAYLGNWIHKRFQVFAKDEVLPFGTVDLKTITDGTSLTNECLKLIEKRWKISDIDEMVFVERSNVDVVVVDNENLSKGFICCIFKDDLERFADQMEAITKYGEEEVANTHAYVPEISELCIVYKPDDDGTKAWYRAQFQQKLISRRAQVGLIDFGVTATVWMKNIRKFDQRFSYGRLNFVGKVRGHNRSLTALNPLFFGLYSHITAEKIVKIGPSFEIHFDDNHFIEDEDFN